MSWDCEQLKITMGVPVWSFSDVVETALCIRNHPFQSPPAHCPDSVKSLGKSPQSIGAPFPRLSGLTRRKPKGDGGKGTGKKTSRQLATSVTTICDILRQFPSLCSIDIKRHKTSEIRHKMSRQFATIL